MRKSKVVLFACIEKNIGDDLFVKIVCNRYPNVEFVITSDANYGSLSNIPNLNFDNKIKKWIWASNIGQKSAFKSMIGHVLCLYYKLRMPKYGYAVNIVGNAFKNMSYEGWLQSRWMRERLRLVKEYILISTNFGPYTDSRWKKDFDTIFSTVTDVCFRDIASFELFKNIPSVRYAPDAVLSLGKQTHNKGGKTVIISVIDCLMPQRGTRLNESAKCYESLMSKCADFYAKNGFSVVLLNSNTDQDNDASRRILEGCKEKEQIRIFSYKGNIEEIMELYSSTQKVIATRLHTIILAWLFDIPVIPVVYDIKVGNILKSYGFTGEKYDIDGLENVQTEQIDHSFEKYDYKISDDLIKQANEQFEVLDRIFNN